MIDLSGSGAVLAHQGGWDETLFVLAPLVVFAVLLLVARRRVDDMEAGERTRSEQDGIDEQA